MAEFPTQGDNEFSLLKKIVTNTAESGGGGGGVTSVNGDTGVVVITASDLGVGTSNSPTFTGATLSGGTLTGGASGLTFAAGGTNQSIVATPSGTGRFVLPNGGLYFDASGTNGSIQRNGASIEAISGTRSDYSPFYAKQIILSRSAFSFAAISLDQSSATTVEINNGTAGTLRDLSLRTLAASGSISATGRSSASDFLTNSYGGVYSPAAGQMRLTTDGLSKSDFGLLQFGGTTSSFPSLKRSGTGLHVRLADDSAYADLSLSTVTASQNLTAAGYIACYGTGGVYLQNNAAGYYLGLSNDVGLGRVGSGEAEINSGTPGTKRDLSLRNLKPTGGNGLAVFTVATLPATAATGLFAGSRVAVSDANSTTFMSTVAGGGSNFVPVLYTGSAWVIA